MPNGKGFDVVIGNPPYQAVTETTLDSGNVQGGLWFKFLKDVATQIVKEDGYVVFITPRFGGIGGIDKINFKFNFFKDNYLSYVNFNADKYFKVNSTICYYILNKNMDKTVVESGEDVFELDLNELRCLPFVVSKLNIKILKKILDKNAKRVFNFKEGNKNIGVSKICLTGGRYGNWKNVFIDTDGQTEQKWKVSLELKNEEIEGASSYIKCRLPKFIFNILGGPNGQSQTGILKNLPVVDLSRVWTDVELYEYFNLTTEEINYIEENVK